MPLPCRREGLFHRSLGIPLVHRKQAWLGSCVEVSVAGYPEIVRAQPAIPAELSILCGLAVDYPDPDFPANRLRVSRQSVGTDVVFVDR
jgi:hypothetical protein